MSKRTVYKTALIVGATSSLAYAISKVLAQQGWRLILTGRDKDELQRLHADLAIRYTVPIHSLLVDLSAENFDARRTVAAAERIAEIDALYDVAADMGDTKWQEGPDNIERVMRVNLVSTSKLIAATAERMVERDRGEIIVISSVAGDRGRKSNFVYGASKAGLTAFASGLRNKLSGTNVHVMTVKPGFIDTRGTFALQSPLVADRMRVARIIIRAARKRRNVIYVPWFWWGIMCIIKCIPEWLFKRLSI